MSRRGSMLRKIKRFPFGNMGPGCHVAWLGTEKSKYCWPLPSTLMRADLPCEVNSSCSFDSAAPASPRGKNSEPQATANKMLEHGWRWLDVMDSPRTFDCM